MTAEAEEIIDAIRTVRREMTGAGSLAEAIAAAPVVGRGRLAIASDGDYQFAAVEEPDGIRVWWRREFVAPEWQPYNAMQPPDVEWRPADLGNLPTGFRQEVP